MGTSKEAAKTQYPGADVVAEVFPDAAAGGVSQRARAFPEVWCGRRPSLDVDFKLSMRETCKKKCEKIRGARQRVVQAHQS
jgi:hypothetical protein